MPGPPPKDPAQRRRRNAVPGFKLLPRTYGAPAPDWPLSGDPSYAEVELWQKLWTLPQAHEWKRMQCEELVALYVSTFVAVPSDSKLIAEVRQLDAKIGLSPKAMRDLRWEVEEPDDEEAEVDAAPVEEQDRTYVPKEAGQR